MSAVLVGHAYYLRLDPKSWAARQPYPPLGTLYAAALLRAAGHDVAVFDAILAESEAGWESALQRERPEIAVVFEDSFNYLSKMCLLRMRQAAFTMFRMAKDAGCTVVACGSDATDRLAEYLANGADYVLIGEGDATVVELLDSLTGRSDVPVHEVPGLAFAGPTGAPVRTAPRGLLRDLDALPLPARDLIDMTAYRDIWERHHGHFSLNVATTRGCPFHCNWCAKPIWGQRYNVRAADAVATEVRMLQTEYGVDHIWFTDDIFGLRPGWLAAFADHAAAGGAPVPFKALSRADLLLRGDEIEHLRRAGCRTVWVGAESGSQSVLDAMEKGTRVEQIEEATRRLHEAGIEVGFFLQFGYPGETRADIRATIDMLERCRPDDIGISVSYPLPGTRFHESVRSQLGSQHNWSDSADLAMMFQGPFTTGFYRRLHTVVHRGFRMRRNWHELLNVAVRPARWQRRHVGVAARIVRDATALPLDRLRLELLARVPHQATALPLQPLARGAAAVPTPQPPARSA